MKKNGTGKGPRGSKGGVSRGEDAEKPAHRGINGVAS